MQNLFIGLLLDFLDFYLDFGTMKLDVIPDFIGYILIYKGLVQLQANSPWFVRIKPFAIGMAVYSGLIFVMDLMGRFTTDVTLSLLLGTASIAISLYITYGIIRGIMELEKTMHRQLQSGKLFQVWKLQAVTTILAHLFIIIPIISVILFFISFIMDVYFLYTFHITRKLFHS